MKLPRHIAIIMDGNGRWAKRRLLPRIAGHKQGVESVRAIIKACAEKGIGILTLFAFSSENWRRPQTEVRFLLSLILHTMKSELQTLHKNQIRLKIMGDRSPFDSELQMAMQEAEHLTAHNQGLLVNIALNFGGRWDIVQATRAIAVKVAEGHLKPDMITESLFQEHMSLSQCPSPDLFIRTSGEERLSNFLLWDIAYSELYFTNTFWPDFREAELEEALMAFVNRERRFGHTTEQLEAETNIEHCANA